MLSCLLFLDEIDYKYTDKFGVPHLEDFPDMYESKVFTNID